MKANGDSGRRLLLLLLGLALLISGDRFERLASASASADSGRTELASLSPMPFGGGPGEVPTPFEVNQLVELADGEQYVLAGRLVTQRTGRVVFRVDLQQHPWLANSRRVKSPFYPIDNAGGILLDKYVDSGADIRMRVMARIAIVGTCGSPTVQLRVLPMSEPVPATVPITPEEIRYRGTKR